MILVGNVVIHEDILNEYFSCNLLACKGACCVEGVSGAPLEKEEAAWLSENLSLILPFMDKKGIRTVEKHGAAVLDSDGELTTPLVGKNAPCAFACKDNRGITYCAIEKAYKEKKISFQKPLSCHLYPIRIERRSGREFLYYHRWSICLAGCTSGKTSGIPLYKFLKEALVRKYGSNWFLELDTIAENRRFPFKK